MLGGLLAGAGLGCPFFEDLIGPAGCTPWYAFIASW